MLKIINKAVLWLLIVLCILSILGLLNFGHGLGNIFYILFIMIAIVVHVVLAWLLRKSADSYYCLPIIIGLIVCSCILYKATLGRGPEFAWNGDIFFIKSF